MKKAAIFDMDGTLVANSPVHIRAFEIFCARYGVTDWREKLANGFGMGFEQFQKQRSSDLYFLQFTPKPNKHEPSGKLAEAINRDFGSFENFKKEFNAASTGLFGSGWAWLSIDKQGKLHITKEPNGSNPWRAGLKPLLGFDVWEHAYYLDYQNRRADHVNKLWEIIDWDVVEKRL